MRHEIFLPNEILSLFRSCSFARSCLLRLCLCVFSFALLPLRLCLCAFVFALPCYHGMRHEMLLSTMRRHIEYRSVLAPSHRAAFVFAPLSLPFHAATDCATKCYFRRCADISNIVPFLLLHTELHFSLRLCLCLPCCHGLRHKMLLLTMRRYIKYRSVLASLAASWPCARAFNCPCCFQLRSLV